MFYNPEKKIFLNKDLNDNFQFKLNDLTNLDSLSYNFKNSDIYEFKPEEKVEMKKNELVKGYQQYFNDTISFYYQFNLLNQFTVQNVNNYLEKINTNISDLINEKSYEYKFILLKKVFYEWIPQIPKDFHMSAYINSNNTNFIFLLNIKNKAYGIDYENNKIIGVFDAVKLINNKINYFYFFEIKKQKKKETIDT